LRAAARAPQAEQAAAPPSSDMNSRRRMPNIGLPSTSAPPVYRTLNLRHSRILVRAIRSMTFPLRRRHHESQTIRKKNYKCKINIFR